MILHPHKLHEALKEVNLLRNTSLGCNEHSLVQTCEEALGYLCTFKEFDNPNPETLQAEGGGIEKIGAWRMIDDEEIWFESAWHANFARYLQFSGVAVSWIYQPKEFEISPFGMYQPTFHVHYKSREWCYVELGLLSQETAFKMYKFKHLFPDEVLLVVNQEKFLREEGFYRSAFPDWELIPALSN